MFNIIIITLLILTLIAAYTDYTKMIIPNWLVVLGIVLAFVYQLVGLSDKTLVELILHFAIYFIPLLLIWIFGALTSYQALAAGDVKFISMMALYIDPFLLFFVLLIAMILISLANITKVSFGFYKEIPKEFYYSLYFGLPGKRKDNLQTVPFGPFMFMSLVINLIYFSVY